MYTALLLHSPFAVFNITYCHTLSQKVISLYHNLSACKYFHSRGWQ